MEKPRRLTKPPPSRTSGSLSSHFGSSSKSRSFTSLQRTPSAPGHPWATLSSHSSKSADGPQRLPSLAYRQPLTSSSSSSLDHTKGASPLLHQQGFTSTLAESPIEITAQHHNQLGPALRPISGSVPKDSTSSPMMESIRNQRNTLRRQPPPPLNYSASDVASSTTMPSSAMPPPLRQSTSFTVGDRNTPPSPPKTQGSGTMSPRRMTDELRPSNSVRKKSGFSSFMNSMLGSPKRVEISSPSNPVHVTHVGFNFVTGEFTVGQLGLFQL